MFEQSEEGGATRPTDASVEASGLAALLRHVLDRALGPGGDVAPETASLIALRKQPSRERELRDFVSALSPGEVNPELWSRWMAGGEEPFQPPKIKRVRGKELNSGRTLERSSSRVISAEAAMEKAERELADRRAEFEQALAFDKAVVQFCVSEHLASIIAPIFAMGPAWTIMRVLSAYVGPAEMAEETAMASTPKRKAEIEMQVRDERRKESEKALRVLDQWGADGEFEGDLRTAIMRVVDLYAERDEDAAARGLRRRPTKDVRSSIRADATMMKDQILDGFPSLDD
jgi:hypothetical protein